METNIVRKFMKLGIPLSILWKYSNKFGISKDEICNEFIAINKDQILSNEEEIVLLVNDDLVQFILQNEKLLDLIVQYFFNNDSLASKDVKGDAYEALAILFHNFKFDEDFLSYIVFSIVDRITDYYGDKISLNSLTTEERDRLEDLEESRDSSNEYSLNNNGLIYKTV